MPYTVTLNHVRYGKYRFDLAELKRRLEAGIATGRDAATLGPLLVHTNRLMAMIDALDAGRHARDLNPAMNAEFALLLLGFEHVQAIMSGSIAPPRPHRVRKQRLSKPRALPGPKRKKPD